MKHRRHAIKPAPLPQSYQILSNQREVAFLYESAFVNLDASLNDIGSPDWIVIDREFYLQTPAMMVAEQLQIATGISLVRNHNYNAMIGHYQLPALRYDDTANAEWIKAANDCPGVLGRLDFLAISIYQDTAQANPKGVLQVATAALSLGLPVYMVAGRRINGDGALAEDGPYVEHLSPLKGTKIKGVIEWNEDHYFYPDLSPAELGELDRHFHDLTLKALS